LCIVSEAVIVDAVLLRSHERFATELEEYSSEVIHFVLFEYSHYYGAKKRLLRLISTQVRSALCLMLSLRWEIAFVEGDK
jgi:hypothetical protein